MNDEMLMPGFSQTVKEFFTTKTNIVALGTLAMTCYGYYIGHFGYGELMAGVSASLTTMTFRDAFKKMGK